MGSITSNSSFLIILLHFFQLYIFLMTFRIVLRYNFWGFLGSSAGKESACNAGDTGSISGSGESTGEGIGCPLQYSGAFLVVQLVKNTLAMWESWVRSLGWEDPLEKGKSTHSSILTGEFYGLHSPLGCQRVRHDWTTFTHLYIIWWCFSP